MELGFGDNNTFNALSSQVLTHLYDKTGFYWITLTVINKYGCWDTTGRSVWIKGEDVLYVPNAFTPNGDGVNEEFLPVGTFNKEAPFEMLIYNRWGELVFETTKYIPWNGKSKGGELCMDGVYIWVISYTDINGISRRDKGRITLLR